MPTYYMNQNAQWNGDHEVHKDGCGWMPAPVNRRYLGEHTSCYTAVAAAKLYDSQADGCAHCSPSCHTS